MARRSMMTEKAAASIDAPAAPSAGRSEAQMFRQSIVTFVVLAAAFVISAIYQVYRSTIMEIPEDAFTVSTSVLYAALVGVSALVLTDKRWAWAIVSILVLFFLALGPFYYYPDVATARDMGPIDWLEASLFMGLLSVAGFICVLRLLCANLVPDHGSRSNEGLTWLPPTPPATSEQK